MLLKVVLLEYRHILLFWVASYDHAVPLSIAYYQEALFTAIKCRPRPGGASGHLSWPNSSLGQFEKFAYTGIWELVTNLLTLDTHDIISIKYTSIGLLKSSANIVIHHRCRHPHMNNLFVALIPSGTLYNIYILVKTVVFKVIKACSTIYRKPISPASSRLFHK